MSQSKAINYYRIKGLEITKHNTNGCEGREEIQSRWVHLRRCITSDSMGCCDSFISNNGTKHFKKIYHAIIR